MWFEEAGRIPKIYKGQTFACGRDGGRWGGFCGSSAWRQADLRQVCVHPAPASLGEPPCPKHLRSAPRLLVAISTVTSSQVVCGRRKGGAGLLETPEGTGLRSKDQQNWVHLKKEKGTKAYCALLGVTSCSRQASSRLAIMQCYNLTFKIHSGEKG